MPHSCITTPYAKYSCGQYLSIDLSFNCDLTTGREAACANMSGETKVADVATQLRERFPINRGSVTRFMEWYHNTYFKTGRFAPVVHVMVTLGVLGYVIEYPHIKHEIEHEKEQASKI